MSTQLYEDYWKYTAAYTDIDGAKFNETLILCLAFIDENADPIERKYDLLQDQIKASFDVNPASIRKAINQMVKLGFINPGLHSYHPLAKLFVNESDPKKRSKLLSKVVYSNAGLNKSATRDDNIRHFNFLVRTLVQKGSLSKEEVMTLMQVNLKDFGQSYVSEDKLAEMVEDCRNNGFSSRKYNQLNHLLNLLDRLEDLTFHRDGSLYFSKDLVNVMDQASIEDNKRDPYLHRVYKKQLLQESEETYGVPKCVVEGVAYPVLIASHIKPFIHCDEMEAYDPDNGLLLSRTLDSLFDLLYVSFDNDGKMIFSNLVSDDVKSHWANSYIKPGILNDYRIEYLDYHRGLMRQRENNLV